jgi:glycosyltransferase involved in cell wall biosynthesis
MPAVMRWTYPKANAIIAVSQGVADDLARTIRMPATSITVVPNPVISTELMAKASEPTDHPWFAEGEDPVIVGVGRLTRAKNFPLLIRAFGRLLDQRPARLMILGEGEERCTLERLACETGLSGRIELPGFRSNPYPFMRNAAAFALSSRWEGMPTALIEALACGTPAVATNCPSGPSEILVGDLRRFLVEVDDEHALASALSDAIDTKLRCDPRVLERFYVDKAAASYHSILKRVQ